MKAKNDYSTELGFLEVVKELIARGADVDEKSDRCDQNPLSYVSRAPENQKELVEVLVAAGADLNQKETICGGGAASHVTCWFPAIEAL